MKEAKRRLDYDWHEILESAATEAALFH